MLEIAQQPLLCAIKNIQIHTSGVANGDVTIIFRLSVGLDIPNSSFDEGGSIGAIDY